MSSWNVWRALFAVHADSDLMVPFRQRDTLRLQPNLYSFGFQDLANRFRYVFILARNQPGTHLDNRDVTPKATIHLGEFQPDITSANDDEMFGQEIHIHH